MKGPPAKCPDPDWCRRHYNCFSNCCPRCQHCLQPIKDNLVYDGWNKPWHRNCRDPDWLETCVSCQQPIKSQLVRDGLGDCWHEDCIERDRESRIYYCPYCDSAKTDEWAPCRPCEENSPFPTSVKGTQWKKV